MPSLMLILYIINNKCLVHIPSSICEVSTRPIYSLIFGDNLNIDLIFFGFIICLRPRINYDILRPKKSYLSCRIIIFEASPFRKLVFRLPKTPSLRMQSSCVCYFIFKHIRGDLAPTTLFSQYQS